MMHFASLYLVVTLDGFSLSNGCDVEMFHIPEKFLFSQLFCGLASVAHFLLPPPLILLVGHTAIVDSGLDPVQGDVLPAVISSYQAMPCYILIWLLLKDGHRQALCDMHN